MAESSPTHLFVAGCPRSGTTALTRLLNCHPEIVVGLERYKRIFGRAHDVKPDMFTAERFFDFRDGDTDFAPGTPRGVDAGGFYERARAKFATARFVGDKYPQFFRFYDKLFRAFPRARVVFIARDPLRVAQSWQRRSEDNTSWPEKNDALRSVGYWNDALAYTLAYATIKKPAFTFVDFDQFYSGQDASLVELCSWIGASLAPNTRAQLLAAARDEFAKSPDILGQDVTLPRAIRNEVESKADTNLYTRVLRMIEMQRARQGAAG